ncbi:MAG: RAD52 family DNA repair protein [Rhizobiaceae bacterium]|nr:RAD52 family DNA repair protein [Rhizobiaceae bacterium]
MAFDQQQERKLRAKLRSRHVRTRQVEDRSLSYVEGWHVISEANRIFGFDGWERETQESRCVYTKQIGNRYTAAYVARIRIIVHAGDRRVIRDGSGAGEATTESPGTAHEVALKAAETDATKRALVTFGNPFGLSLYSCHVPTSGKNSRKTEPRNENTESQPSNQSTRGADETRVNANGSAR